MSTLYQNAYRNNLDDNSDVEALEQASKPVPAEPEVSPEDPLTPLPEKAETVEEQTFKKRYGDLRAYHEKSIRELKAKVDALTKAQEENTSKVMALPTTKDEIEEWVEAYPDVAKIVRALAAKEAEEKTKALESRFKELDKKEAMTAQKAAEIELMKAHPDFREISNDVAFHDWAKVQPKWVQQSLYENATDWKAAARSIDLYKMDQEKAKPVRKAKPVETAASLVPEKGGRNEVISRNDNKKVWRESEIAKLNSRDWEKHEADITLAQREGRLILDLSAAS